MDIALIKTAPVFIQNYFKKNNDIYHLLNIIIKEDIDINFDSTQFNIFGTKSYIHVPINDKTHPILLQAILKCIENNDMNDVIRNSNNKIHFRSYKKKYIVDCETDVVRISLLNYLCEKIDTKIIINEMIKISLQIRNELKEKKNKENDLCKMSVIFIRIKRLITILRKVISN